MPRITMANTVTMLLLGLTAQMAAGQMVLTGNLAFNSPAITRPDLAVAEPLHLQMAARSLRRAGRRSLLQGGSWGKDNQAGKAFPQGVSSGDPTEQGFILWTRVPGPEIDPKVAQWKVDWAVANDKDMKDVVASGSTFTDAVVDWTVKVDVTKLQANKIYYYQFKTLTYYSKIGRTKTLPMPNDPKIDRVAFGVVSCSNLPVGYFNAYQEIAKWADAGRMDAVLHLGDWFYEYNTTSNFTGRTHMPMKEIVLLDDYRIRHRQYASDLDTMAMHAALPLIAVWDDHELANNAWRNGAQNHDNDDGEMPRLIWDERATNAVRAYYEYMPIRQADPDDKNRIYRKFQYGKLASLIMLDTRFYGRDQEYPGPLFTTDDRFNRTEHDMLGEAQRTWLHDNLVQAEKTKVTWKVLGQQVFFGRRYLTVNGSVSTDAWDGYNYERERIFNTIEQNKINNMVVLTGDVHASFALDLPREPTKPYNASTRTGYDRATGKGSLGVEMVCNSVTSNAGRTGCQALDYQTGNYERNPNIKYASNFLKGFLYLEITEAAAAGTWVDMSTVFDRKYTVTYSDTYVSETGANHLVTRPGQYKPKSPQPVCTTPPSPPSPPAPAPPPPVM